MYDEANKISLLLDAGVDYVHIRKPDWSLRDVRNLIEDIPYNLRSRLRLHGHFGLTAEMNLGGVHLNRRNPVAPRYGTKCDTFVPYTSGNTKCGRI